MDMARVGDRVQPVGATGWNRRSTEFNLIPALMVLENIPLDRASGRFIRRRGISRGRGLFGRTAWELI
jgi:hypothetical protein